MHGYSVPLAIAPLQLPCGRRLACGWSVVLAPSASAMSDSRAADADSRKCSRLKKAERRTAWLDGSPGSGEGERCGVPPGAPAGCAAARPAGPPAGRCSGTAEASMAAAASATAGCARRQCASHSSWPTTATREGALSTGWLLGVQAAPLSCRGDCPAPRAWIGQACLESGSPTERRRRHAASASDSCRGSSRPKMRARTSVCTFASK